MPNQPDIEIRDENFFPLFSNNFTISRNDADEFFITFSFSDPPQHQDRPGKIKSIARIALSKTGATKLLQLLNMALSQQPPQGPSRERF